MGVYIGATSQIQLNDCAVAMSGTAIRDGDAMWLVAKLLAVRYQSHCMTLLATLTGLSVTENML